MTDVTFKSATPAAEPITQSTLPDPEPNKIGQNIDSSDIEPVSTDGSAVLESLDIEENLKSLPEEDLSNLKEVNQYILDTLKTKGIDPTLTNFKETLDNIKFEMGLDPKADPQTVLDRIGGVVKSWKQLTFVKNPQEKRSLFMKLARQQSSKDMNRIVFEEMENHTVWQ